MLNSAVSLALLSRAAAYLLNSTEYASGALGPAPVQDFVSSSSRPALWNFHDHPSTSDGHIFVTQHGPDVVAPGAYLHANDGELVFDADVLRPNSSANQMNFQRGVYRGKPVLTLWQGRMVAVRGYGYGAGYIYDERYRLVARVQSTAPGGVVDIHEFALTAHDTAVLVAYVPTRYDLTPYGGSAEGWVFDCYAQEIDVATGKELWSWSALDNVSPKNSNFPLLPGVGSREEPWDWFHMNSVERTPHGFLVSSRQLATVYHISRDGKLLWQLGGADSTFELDDENTIHAQHDARWVEEGAVSIWDNAVAATPGKEYGKSSRGIVVEYDVEAGQAKIRTAFIPFNNTHSFSQGSLRHNVDDTWIVGGGSVPIIGEYTPSGEPIWSASFGVGDVQNYRAFRGSWKGYPTTTPSLAIKKNKAYVSWNGATEVDRWVLYSNGPGHRKSVKLASVERKGFETAIGLPKHLRNIQARAVDAKGRTLGWTHIVNARTGDILAPPSAQQVAESYDPDADAEGSGVWRTILRLVNQAWSVL